MSKTQRRSIDFRHLADEADLEGLIVADLGQPDRSRRWACPFHDDHNPDLGYHRPSNRWKCWACGANGDAIDWLTEHRGLTVIEAAAFLGADVGARPGNGPGRPVAPSRPTGTTPGASVAPKRQEPAPSWLDPNWQRVVDEVIRRAEVELWSAEGKPARQWLRWRGLDDSTIKTFALGFVARPYETEPLAILDDEPGDRPRGLWIPRGVVFPFIHPDAWYCGNDTTPGPRWIGANVRRLAEGDVFAELPKAGGGKCRAIPGTERNHLYPWPTVEPTQGELPMLIVEGELDALVGWQEAGHVLHVGTIGGANAEPRSSVLAALDRCPRWLIATDHDARGSAAAWGWIDRSPEKARRALLPFGKDLAEFHQLGGYVLGWLRSEHDRLGWEWSLDAPGVESPGIVVGSDWRWEVAGWPIARWLEWRRRSGELLTPGADASAIREAGRIAYAEIRDRLVREPP